MSVDAGGDGASAAIGCSWAGGSAGGGGSAGHGEVWKRATEREDRPFETRGGCVAAAGSPKCGDAVSGGSAAKEKAARRGARRIAAGAAGVTGSSGCGGGAGDEGGCDAAADASAGKACAFGDAGGSTVAATTECHSAHGEESERTTEREARSSETRGDCAVAAGSPKSGDAARGSSAAKEARRRARELEQLRLAREYIALSTASPSREDGEDEVVDIMRELVARLA